MKVQAQKEEMRHSRCVGICSAHFTDVFLGHFTNIVCVVCVCVCVCDLVVHPQRVLQEPVLLLLHPLGLKRLLADLTQLQHNTRQSRGWTGCVCAGCVCAGGVCVYSGPHLPHLVLGGSDALHLLLLRRLLALLHLVFALLLKEVTLGSLLQVGHLLE